jgi:hypothetical protein
MSKPIARFILRWFELAENPLLTRLIMELRDGMRLYGIDSSAGRQRQLASVGEHYALIELAAAGKVGEIAALIDRHIKRMEASDDRLGQLLHRREVADLNPGVPAVEETRRSAADVLDCTPSLRHGLIE